ncbi:unnamed protein product [Pleuronectes platessa]|uniref:Uncharacterized protein n=1 Tax=Pleuronectes platessa TaxID=8262 RepID=A0A9N7UGT2_PLEPL|nr:unnamed protein product [Pleuronectes platessa]
MGAAACRNIGSDPGDHCLSTEPTQWDTLPGFSHITGGQGARAIFWAVAGKGYGPLFSSSPPVVTNPAESERHAEESEWAAVVAQIRAAEQEETGRRQSVLEGH